MKNYYKSETFRIRSMAKTKQFIIGTIVFFLLAILMTVLFSPNRNIISNQLIYSFEVSIYVYGIVMGIFMIYSIFSDEIISKHIYKWLKYQNYLLIKLILCIKLSIVFWSIILAIMYTSIIVFRNFTILNFYYLLRQVVAIEIRLLGYILPSIFFYYVFKSKLISVIVFIILFTGVMSNLLWIFFYRVLGDLAVNLAGMTLFEQTLSYMYEQTGLTSKLPFIFVFYVMIGLISCFIWLIFESGRSK